MAFYGFNPDGLSYVDVLHACQQSERFPVPNHRYQAPETDQCTCCVPAALLTTPST